MKKKYFKISLLTILINFSYAKSQTSPFTNNTLQMSNIHENEGRANINIPIEKLEIKNYTLDINAIYDSKGVKVNAESGEIGQNWDLSYKGIITRKIQDKADEKKVNVTKTVYYGFFQNGTAYPKCYVLSQKNQEGLLYNLPIIKTNTEKFFNTPNPASNYVGPVSPKFNLNDYSQLSGVDKQSDLFTVIIPGKEPFSFYFDLDGNIKLNSSEKYKVEYEVDNYSFFKKFTLVDEENVHFTFDSFETVKQDSEKIVDGWLSGKGYPLKKLNSLNTPLDLPLCDPSDPAFSYYYDKVPVSWYLSKIENKYGEKIKYSYEQKKVLSINVNSKWNYSSVGYCGYTAHVNEIPVITSITNETSSLKFNYGEVRKDMLNFDNSNFSNVPRLTSISSFYGNSKRGTVAFDSDYILSNDSNGLTLQDSELAVYRRLFLKNIFFLNPAEDKVKDKYEFEYNNPQILPHKQTFKTDIWGFYKNNPDVQYHYLDNDLVFQTVSVPETQIRLYRYLDSGLNNVDRNYYSIYKRNNYIGTEEITTGADKTPVLTDLSIGLLSKLKHHGGSISYQYDSNYFTYYGTKREGPGVRIKTIEVNDGVESTFTDYSYGENNDGIGYIDSLPAFITIIKTWSGGSGYLNNGLVDSKYYVADNTILYKKIRSSKRKANINNGYTINSYSLFDPINNSTFNIGSLIYKSNRSDAYNLRCISGNCENISGQYQLDVTSTPLLVPEADMSRVNGKLLKQEIYDNNNTLLESTDYNYQLQWSQLNKIHLGGYRMVANSSRLDIGVYGGVEKYYSFNYDPQIIVTKYFYNNGIVQKTNTYTYNNERKVTELKEQIGNDITKTEFKYAYESNTALGNALRTQNRLNEIQESTITTNGGGIIKNRNIYNEFTFPTMSSANKNIIVGTKHETSIDGTNFFGSEEITKLGPNGNVIEKKYNGSIYETIIWGYKHNFPIAKVFGASYQEVMQAFNLDPNNISSFLDLDIVKKSDQDLDDLSEANFITALEDFKNKTELKAYQITTYTYDPLIGVKNIIKSFGGKESYIYDTNNRLQRILDSDNKIAKEYNYNVNNNSLITYLNVAKSQSFTTTNCSPGTIPVSGLYTVPAAKYSSLVSQVDADQKALNDINSNGQSYVNTNISCTPYVCTITPTHLANINYSSFQEASFNHIKGTLSFSFSSSGGSSPNWSDGVFIGTLDSRCRPSSHKSISVSSGSWYVSIGVGGDISVRSTSSVGSSGGTTLYFEYDKN